MFQSARLKLTAWYLLIIMIITSLFSFAMYHAATEEIERLINRIEYRQHNPNIPVPERFIPRNAPSAPSLEELENSKEELAVTLILINGLIWVIAGTAGYFLAGRTLRPIQEMMEEQYQFVSNASHELRTPIATMRAEMEGHLLEANITDKQARSLVNSNLEELGTLQDLTNHLLLLTQFQNTPLEKYTGDVSLLSIIKSAEKKIMPLAKKKNIKITNSIKDYHVQGNKAGLQEVFINILDNAIKYSHENTHISITAGEMHNYVSVHISDEGIGIAKEDIPHIFERFYRADKSRSSADGFGLGLSIAKKIMELHKGSISVKSEKNNGTTFIVQIPVIRS